MSEPEKEIKCIISYLTALNFHFPHTWILQCINDCKSTTPNISLEVLKNILKQKWLSVNLRDFKISAFPANLISCEKTILHGRYAVQVESMIDCSKSCYSQLLNLQKIVEDEATESTKEPKIKSDRCLIFVISDGVQELKAMEHKIIKKIKPNDPTLLPGFKIIIIGPVECRRGMLLLNDENVRLCGGEVDSLIATNNLQYLLMQKLDITVDDLPTANFNGQNNYQNGFNHTESSKNIKCETENVEALLSENDDIFFSLPTEYETSSAIQKTNISSTVENSVPNNADFVTVKHESEFVSDAKMLKKRSLPLEEKFSRNSKKFSFSNKVDTLEGGTNMEIQNLVKINDIEDMKMNEDVMVVANFSHFKKESISQFTKAPVQTKIHSFLKKNNLSNSCDFNKEKNEIINGKLIKPFIVDCKPFVYLKDIKFASLKTTTIVRIKCVVLTLKKKITIENDKFNLIGVITDGSDSTDASFCSSIIENFLDYSPCEMEAMMKNRFTNSATNDQIKEAFRKAQQKFISLNCLMKVKFFPDKTTPVILSLEELTLKHLNALKQRTLI